MTAHSPPPMHTLSAAGLTLEPQCASHAHAMFDVLADRDIYTYLDDAPPASADVLHARFLRLESRASGDGREQWLNWAIRVETGALAGIVQATVCEGGLAWIAFVIGRRFWGQGVAQRAARAVLDECAAHYGVTQWLATADARNSRSIRLLARLGFSAAAPALRGVHDVADTDVLLRLRPQVHNAAA